MCVAMVIIYKKTSEKKGAEDVMYKRTNLGLTMSQGTALFTCGLMETSRWREVAHSCVLQKQPVGSSLENLWDVLPEVHSSSTHWDWDVGHSSSTITSLLQDLKLSEPASSIPTAPPSKRQCRSLSCSDELASCRSGWRPQGSRVWTAVEKRRCHSGGSVQRGNAGNIHLGFPAMQRSSSFSLPTRSNLTEPPSFTQQQQRRPWPAAFTGRIPLSSEPSPRPLFFSHEQICLPEPCGPSPSSSPDSTPELERRGGPGGLARSRSQPCVLNDKKIGVKRRRPADTQKQRPSLDLAKMTQKLQNFHSLSCQDDHDSKQDPPHLLRSSTLCDADDDDLDDTWTKEITITGDASPDVDWISTDSGNVTPETPNGKDSQALWAGLCRKDTYQLGGEIDIEQIERN
ncbi:protein FAM53B [Gouania willdenowi]|uniref:Protein FAM53B-like n=1 Tax=Gouania willdenowi TaxID=441366 RepID=A0A8C5I8S8_GOUWI|nr:protein FAM53B-like [Gouania willdenowi]